MLRSGVELGSNTQRSAAQRAYRSALDCRAAGQRPDVDPEGGARARRGVPRRAQRRRPRPGRGAAQDRCAARADRRAAHAAIHGQLPEEHRGRVAPVALGVRPGQGVHGRLQRGAEGGLPPRRQQALARRVAVGTGAARVLQGHRRQVPALPLRALDSCAMAGIPRALRVRADARLAARAAGAGRGRVLPPRRVRRAGILEDAPADASRLRKLHAGSGRMGGEATRRLVALPVAYAAARQRRGLLRRSHRHAGTAAPGPAARGWTRAVSRRDACLWAHRRADALAPGAGRRSAEARRAAVARAATPADAARLAVRARSDRPCARAPRGSPPTPTCVS